MKLLFSIPSGYHLRELVMPLKSLLEKDASIQEVICLTPGAPYKNELFPAYGSKFTFINNPKTQEDHQKILQDLTPTIVITNTVGLDELDYPILEAAKALFIPTLTFIASWDNVWKIGRLLKKGQAVSLPDHLIVWNAMMKEHLHKLFPNLKEDAVSIIGAPRLDYFWQHDQIPTKHQLYKHLNLSDITRPLMHVTTTELYPLDYIVSSIKKIIEATPISPKPYIYASVHPGGDLKNHINLETRGAIVRYSFGRQDSAPLPSFTYNPTLQDQFMLTALFTHADLLVNHSSSTALESLIGGTPVINIKYGRPLDWWRWYRSSVYQDFKEHYKDIIKDNATYIVKNKQQLAEAIQDALRTPTAKKDNAATTIKRMITTVDGTASQKVLDKIKQQIA